MMFWWRRRRMYEQWMRDIVVFRMSRGLLDQELLSHMHHHVSEGETEGVSPEWLASMYNLLEIMRRIRGLKEPTLRERLQRMLLHWQKDPDNTTPPPSLKHLIDGAADRLIDDAEYRLGKPKPEPASEINDWTGS